MNESTAVVAMGINDKKFGKLGAFERGIGLKGRGIGGLRWMEKFEGRT